MWKGLKKALGKPGKSKKASSSFDRFGLDVSTRSTSSAAPSSVLFPLDLADADALASWSEQNVEQEQQLPSLGRRAGTAAAGPDPLTASQLQQQLQQQLVVQQLVQRTDDHSAGKRQAAALQKRIDNQMLNPSTCLYQISSLLSLSTLFEHKLQRDAFTALRQLPCPLVSGAAANAAAAERQHLQEQQQMFSASPQQQQQLAQLRCEHSGSTCSSVGSSCGGCVSRTASATAASTAHVALTLSRWGYRVIVRKVLHSKAYWTKSMDNTFIVALDASSGSHVEYVVDPHFKETFNVGVMSANYSAVWHSLPQVFVGMPCQLQPVVQLLCEEVELSFLEAGRPCPPWREWAATINRWMSDQYVDILVPEPTATDDEVVEFITRCCQFSGAAAGPGSATAGNSGASASTASTCSPVNLNQQRLQDKMHVSSVLSSASTSSRRCVPEPLHKQLGFSAVAEDEGASQLLPTTLRDASFTSITSEASAESVQMLSEAQAAAKAAASKPLGIAARSLSVPSAELLSSSADSGSVLDCECFEEVPDLLQPAAQQQQQPDAAASQQACELASSSSSRDASAAAEQRSAGQPPAGRSKSLLTAHMQLKAQLQQQQQRLLFPAASAACLGQGMQVVPQLQQQQVPVAADAALLQQVAPQQQQQLLLQQLQLQHQQMLAQHMALQQPQQGVQPHLTQQQLALLQQRCSQPTQQERPGVASLQQQQLVAPLLPVVHTVRPCGVATAAPAAQAVLQQQLQQVQQQPRQPLMQVQQQLHAVQAPVQQEQPRLLRLIQRK